MCMQLISTEPDQPNYTFYDKPSMQLNPLFHFIENQVSYYLVVSDVFFCTLHLFFI